MPTYQYACTACGHQLEAVQSFTDAPLTECPTCEGRLRKVFSSVGVVFKGSGFYRTDSRESASGSSSKDGAAKDGAAKDGGAKDGGAKTETTSESKSESKSGSKSDSKSEAKPAAPAAAKS